MTDMNSVGHNDNNLSYQNDHTNVIDMVNDKPIGSDKAIPLSNPGQFSANGEIKRKIISK